MADGKNIYLLIGEEPLKKDFIESLIEKYVGGEFKAFNLDVLKGKEATAEQILSKASMMPVMSEHRLIIVSDLSKLSGEEQSNIAQNLGKIPPSTIIVFSIESWEDLKKGKKGPELKKELMKMAIVKSFLFTGDKKEVKAQKEAWIREELRKRGVKMTREAFYTLTSMPMDAHKILSEIEKLATFAQGQVIKREDIENLVVETEEVKTYELVNAVFEGRTSEAMRALSSLLETGDMWTPLIILHALASQARLLFQVKLLQERGIGLNKLEGGDIGDYLLQGDNSISFVVKGKDWLTRRLEGQARRFSKKALYSLFRLLLKIDMDIKQGADARERLEYFIFKVAGIHSLGETQEVERSS
ncbi:MAG: DNA polymerase III subunit delta [bacterium]